MTESVTRISRPTAWREAFIRQHDYRCHYCNRFAGAVEVGPDSKPWHVDHKVALANGGADVEDNLTLACERCNQIKRTLPYENFRAIARSAFWAAEPQRIQDQDLEELTTTFLRTTDGTWSIRMDHEGNCNSFGIRAHWDQELDDGGDESVATVNAAVGRKTGGYHDAHFIVLAHRLMPKLIAEIHLLRAALSPSATADQET